MTAVPTHAQTTAVWVGSFFGELVRWGVREVVVSPGSRSTALAMAAYELSSRRPCDLRVWMDVDERGAAFFGLGLAKASGRPVALVCTSGTAHANYYPAVIEAETSRVPLLVLTGDRPGRLQGLGAPQTADQLNAFGSHVRAFRAMPEPGATLRDVAFARQAAREACLAALGGYPVQQAGADEKGVQVASRACAAMAGPVQVNFPFEEPLKPDFSGVDAFGTARSAWVDEPLLTKTLALDAAAAAQLERALEGKRVLVLAGEGSCATLEEAKELVVWAKQAGYPLLADPLSGLRTVNDQAVIDNYDNVFGQDDCPLPSAVIRFGRWPVSKRVVQSLVGSKALNVVVDAAETRDFNSATDVFAPMPPLSFARSFRPQASGRQLAYLDEWIARNNAARDRILAVEQEASERADALEGAYVRSALRLTPEGACVFVANSMAVRAVDTFYVKDGKPLCLLCNRGQNGIDGTTSTALGAAQGFSQTVYLTGDFTMLHDLSALALQNEMLRHHAPAPAVLIVLVNNNGGAIFDMLPQASDEPYFERLFLAPQNIDFSHAAAAFGVSYESAPTLAEFEDAFKRHLGVPGISIVEVTTPLRGVRNRYNAYQR